MANGYYLFDSNIVNKSTQSAVAMAAYRSGDKLYSLRDGETKNYRKREVEAESFILKPDNAPDWTLDRERLWNKVEQFEERDNAQIARNILLGLPNDMTNEQQLELTKEYVQESFVDEGMVADVSIHRDEENNPHAHILLTVRAFDEQMEWEKRKSKRVPVLDQDGNQTYNEKGWRKTQSIKLNDWDSTKTLVQWRENWSDKLNEKSLEFGLEREYSDKSYEEQGKLEKPRFRLTRSEYQFEERVKMEASKEEKEYEPTTYYAKKNVEIKDYNEKVSTVVHLKDYQADKQYKDQLGQIRKQMHENPANVEATELLVKRVKGYVDYDVSKKLHADFSDERNKWRLNLERAKKMLESKQKLYARLIKEYRKDPSTVETYGYNIDTFKDEMREEVRALQKEEVQYNKELNKYIELKEATVTSLKHQEKVVDAEFNSIHEDVNEHEFSYEEKNFAMKLLKEHSILLPKELIKDEYVHQGKDLEDEKLYVPTWKQAKDTMKSIRVYNRTLNKLNRQDMKSLSPDKLKDTIIKLASYSDLKSSYEKYLNEITPIIDQELHSISENKHVSNADVEVKVALLEEHSTLSEEQKEELDIEKFLHHVKEVQDKDVQSYQALGQSQEDDDPIRKEVINDFSKNTQKIADGLFSILQALANEKNLSQGKNKKDRTKPYRRKGTDGREL